MEEFITKGKIILDKEIPKDIVGFLSKDQSVLTGGFIVYCLSNEFNSSGQKYSDLDIFTVKNKK